MKFRHFLHRAKRIKRLTQLIVLMSFLITFGLVRAITHLQKAGYLPNQTGDVHVHHLVPGIFLLLITGYIGLSFWHHAKLRQMMAVLYGVGAALVMDEFALWLYLHDVYWSEQGRDSIDAVIITTALMILVFVVSEIYDIRSSRIKHLHEQENQEKE